MDIETAYFVVGALGSFILGGLIGMRIGATIYQNQLDKLAKEITEPDNDKEMD